MCRTGLPHAAVLQDAPFFSHQAGEGEKKTSLCPYSPTGSYSLIIVPISGVRRKYINQPGWNPTLPVKPQLGRLQFACQSQVTKATLHDTHISVAKSQNSASHHPILRQGWEHGHSKRFCNLPCSRSPLPLCNRTLSLRFFWDSGALGVPWRSVHQWNLWLLGCKRDLTNAVRFGYK